MAWPAAIFTEALPRSQRMARCARTIGESLPRRRAWADITSDEEEEAALPAGWVLWGGDYFLWLPKKKGMEAKTNL